MELASCKPFETFRAIDEATASRTEISLALQLRLYTHYSALPPRAPGHQAGLPPFCSALRSSPGRLEDRPTARASPGPAGKHRPPVNPALIRFSGWALVFARTAYITHDPATATTHITHNDRTSQRGQSHLAATNFATNAPSESTLKRELLFL